MVIRQDKNRNGPELTLTLAVNWSKGAFSVELVSTDSGRGNPAQDVDEKALRTVLEAQVLAWQPQATVVRAAMDVTGHARGTVYRKLRGMIQDGLIDSRSVNGSKQEVRVLTAETFTLEGES